MNIVIRPAKEKDYPDILRMNEADVEMLSPIDDETLRRMKPLTTLFQVAEIDEKVAAFQMVYRERSAYWSENYAWFCEHYAKFLYVDRIVVDKNFRQYGLGRRLYEEVIRLALETDVPIITAEIDIVPKRNDPSLTFHKKMGFHEVGTKLFKETVTVSLQVKKV